MTAHATVQSLHDTVTARIISELEAGRFPWAQPWAASGVTPLGLPQNAATGRTYSGVNILLLWFAAIEQRRCSQRWLTFKQALALGGCVRKGETGTMIVYADSYIPKAEREKGEDARRAGFLKRFTVFHVDQCDGMPATPDAQTMPGGVDVIPAAEAVVAATGADIRIFGDMAFYSPAHDFIQIPPQQAYFEPVNWYRTKLHELGHNAERRIMPHGRSERLWRQPSTVRRLGIIFSCSRRCSLDVEPTRDIHPRARR